MNKINIEFVLYDFLEKNNIPFRYLRFLIYHLYQLKYEDFLVNQENLDVNICLDFINQYQKNPQPLPYIFGFEMFKDQMFYITKDVLIPRVESEALVDLAFNNICKNIKKQKINILDLCCGSGVLGISLTKLLSPYYQVSLYCADISKKALEVCKKNLAYHKIDATVLCSDLFANIKQNEFDVIITNPPYVPQNEKLDDLVLQEPHLALFAGEDGMKIYKQIFIQLNNINYQLLVGEIHHLQAPLFKQIDQNILIYQDEFGYDRYIVKENYVN